MLHFSLSGTTYGLTKPLPKIRNIVFFSAEKDTWLQVQLLWEHLSNWEWDTARPSEARRGLGVAAPAKPNFCLSTANVVGENNAGKGQGQAWLCLPADQLLIWGLVQMLSWFPSLEAEQHLGLFVSQGSRCPAQTCPWPWCFPPSLCTAGSSRISPCLPLAAPRPRCACTDLSTAPFTTPSFGEACRDMKDIIITLCFSAKKGKFQLHTSHSLPLHSIVLHLQNGQQTSPIKLKGRS